MIFPRISRFLKNYIAYVIRKLYVEYTLGENKIVEHT